MNWRGLLVSVRDPLEAEEALAGGAAIIDVKDPLAGALGAASPETAAGVARVVAARDWTCACGELDDGSGIRAGVDRVATLVRRVAGVSPSPPAAVKAGLSRVAGGEWRHALGELVARLPGGVGFVAVAYADHLRAEAPLPEEVIDAAREGRCAGVLVDTFDKTGPGLFGLAGAATVATWVARAHAAGLPIALAGRLSLDDIDTAVGTAADLIAVRSAACAARRGTGAVDGDRLGAVDRHRVSALVSRMAGADRAAG